MSKLIKIQQPEKPRDVTFFQYLVLQYKIWTQLPKDLRGLVKAVVLLVIGCFATVGYVGISAAGTLGASQSHVAYNIVRPAPLKEEVASEPESQPAVPVNPLQKKRYRGPENECAPKLPTKSASPEKYILQYKNAAISGMKKYGVPASISLAQGIIESRSGTSGLAVNNNNHFGMKCFSRNCRKGHCTNFTDDTHKDFFLKFASPQQSWDAHSKLLASGRYTKLKKYGKDYRRWAVGLKSCGYATDRTYAQKLISVIERYDLYKYDR